MYNSLTKLADTVREKSRNKPGRKDRQPERIKLRYTPKTWFAGVKKCLKFQSIVQCNLIITV